MNMLNLIFPMIILFPLMNHPLSMGMILLMQTIFIAMTTGILNSNFWFSYILFLVMIGGMLILFIYMTSVASNEKFKTSMNTMLLLFSIIILTFMINFNSIWPNNKMKESLEFTNYNMNMITNVKYYMPEMNMLLISLMMYLLLTLVMTVKITKKEKGPLRKK